MSESNRTQLRYVPEVTYGVTPVDDGGWKPLPMNSEGLNVGPATTQSQRIRGTDRMPADLKKVNTNVAGPVASDFSFGDFDDFLEGVMYAAYTEKATITASTISATTPDTFSDSGNGFISAGFAVGDIFVGSGWTDPDLNKTFTILTVAAGVITTVEQTVDTEAAGSSITMGMGTNRLTAGTTDAQNQFTIEKEFDDLTAKYIQLKGCRVGQFDLSFVIGEIISANIVFQGASGLEAAASLVGSGSEAAASGNEVLAGNVDMDTITYDNVLLSVSGIVVTRIDLSINNTLRPINSLTSLTPVDQKSGTHRFTGVLEAYIDDNSWEIYQDMLNNTQVSLSWVVTGADGSGYKFTLPAIKVSGDAPAAGGIDQDNMVRCDFLAINTVPTIDRIPVPT